MENMYERMVKVNPENPILTALDTLTEPGDMEAFFRDCVEAYRSDGDNPEVRKNPKDVVRSNIGYFLTGCDAETVERWRSATKGLSHPYFEAIPLRAN